jgi:hypothetical protein
VAHKSARGCHIANFGIRQAHCCAGGGSIQKEGCKLRVRPGGSDRKALAGGSDCTKKTTSITRCPASKTRIQRCCVPILVSVRYTKVYIVTKVHQDLMNDTLRCVS